MLLHTQLDPSLPGYSTVRRWACGAAVVLLLAGCAGGVLDPQGPVGVADRQMMMNALAIMLAIVVPTIAAALAFAWWFRASNPRALRRPHWAYSGRVELIVWSIPLLVIMFVSGLIWIGSHELDPYRPIASQAKPLELQVVSLDWKWLFIYPEQGVATVNELVVPAGVPLHFSLTSATVMNAFFVPQLGSMIATMNGMVTQLYLQADHTGEYYGASTQFSGEGFSDMNFVLRAVPAGSFGEWVRKVRDGAPALDRSSYAELARESQKVRPSTYRVIDPGLFDAVVTQAIVPGGGPQHGPGGTGVHPRPGG